MSCNHIIVTQTLFLEKLIHIKNTSFCYNVIYCSAFKFESNERNLGHFIYKIYNINS